MPLPHRYTTAALTPDDPCFVARTPGLADLVRLFPSPSSPGRGRLAVEGGVSVVAGPGMGKTSLLRALASHLEAHRNMAAAYVSVPAASQYPGEDGFYALLGDLVRGLRAALRGSTPMDTPAFERVAQVLALEPAWDVDGALPGMSPRGMERWIAQLGAAAVQTPGLCLLFDDADNVVGASWKNAFVAGLRFTFQTCAGITPVYALWSLFADESLAGSNYFRNVTRPFFLEPLGGTAYIQGRSEREILLDVHLSGCPSAASAAIFALAGGHPQLLHRVLGDVCDALDDAHALTTLAPGALDALLAPYAEAQRRLARDLVAGTPGLAAALRDLARQSAGGRAMPVGLVASGLVDHDAQGVPVLPGRVREVV